MRTTSRARRVRICEAQAQALKRKAEKLRRSWAGRHQSRIPIWEKLKRMRTRRPGGERLERKCTTGRSLRWAVESVEADLSLHLFLDLASLVEVKVCACKRPARQPHGSRDAARAAGHILLSRSRHRSSRHDNRDRSRDKVSGARIRVRRSQREAPRSPTATLLSAPWCRQRHRTSSSRMNLRIRGRACEEHAVPFRSSSGCEHKSKTVS